MKALAHNDEFAVLTHTPSIGTREGKTILRTEIGLHYRKPQTRYGQPYTVCLTKNIDIVLPEDNIIPSEVIEEDYLKHADEYLEYYLETSGITIEATPEFFRNKKNWEPLKNNEAIEL